MNVAKNSAPTPPTHEFGWPELAAAMFAAKGITSGQWRLGIKLRFGGTTGGWQSEAGLEYLPTAMTGLDSVALWPANEPGPMVFDAAAKVPAVASKNKRPRAGKRPAA